MAAKRTDNIDLIKQRLYHETGKNLVLSDYEEDVVREMLSEALLNVKNLGLEISRLQSLRQKEIKQIERYRLSLNVSRSPQKKMPPEILAEIFSHCIGEGPIPFPPKPRDLCAPPWVLLHVCSRWRQVMKRGRFTTFHVPWGYRPGNWHTTHDILSTFQHCTLTLDFTGHMIDPTLIENVFLRYLSRIKELSLSFSATSILNSEILARGPRMSFESLETLSLLCGMLPPAAVFEILRRSNRLSTIYLVYDRVYDHVTPRSSSREKLALITLPNLRSVHLCLHGSLRTLPTIVKAFTESLVAPHLDHISVVRFSLPVDTHRRVNFPCDVLKALIDRSKCQLNSLRIHCWTQEPELERLLRSVPTLKALTLGFDSEISGLVISAMTDGDLLPQLEEVECCIDSREGFSSTMAWLTKRVSGDNGLQGRVVARVDGRDIQMAKSDVRALGPKIRRGFKIELRC